MKQLFGITGTKNSVAINARNIICSSANLLHTNIKQPVFKELSLQTGYSEFELEHHVDLFKTLPGREFSAIELYCQIEQAIIEASPDALMHAAENDMLSKNVIAKLARGYLVSGIDNDTEANWLRELDGILIHVIDKNSPSLTPTVIIDENDIIISFDTFRSATRECMQPILNQIISLTKPRKEAA